MYYFLSMILCLTVMMSPTVGKAQQAALFGVNLAAAEFGNRFPGSYGKDYTYPTAEELDYYKRKNLKLIRLPFAWERIQPTLNSRWTRPKSAI
jgi:aryl-phospho-beta-D-glucosidase BglC (GH1 family)